MQEKRKHPEIPAPPQGFGFFQQVIEQLRLTWALLVDLAVVLMAVTLFNMLAPAEVVAEHLTQMRIRRSVRISQDQQGTVIDIKLSEQTDDPLEGEVPSPKQKASKR